MLRSPNNLESLADFVSRVRREGGWSCKEVAKNSGGHISDGYVSLIENNGVKNVGPSKLKALARGLRVTEEEIFAVARGVSITAPDALEKKLLSKFRELPPDRQSDVLKIVEALHRAHSVDRAA